MATKNKKKHKKQKHTPKPINKEIPFWKNTDLLLPLAILLLLTVFAFYPSLNNDFVNWDDDVNIIENENLAAFDWPNIKAIFSDKVMGGYNPLAIFTFAIEKHFFGLNPKVFHTTNLLLHLLCVFFVYRIALEMKISKMAAIFLTALFAVHPMRVESVAWATERKDVLFGAFYLSAIWSYILYLNGKRKENKYLIYTMILFVFSLFSKIQAVSLPLSLLCLDYYLGRKLSLKLIIEKWPFFLGSLLFGLMGIFFLSEANTLEDSTNYTILERLLVGALSFSVYLIKWIIPYEMVPLYPYPKALEIEYYLAPLGVLATLGIGYYTFKKELKALTFGLAFFFVNIVFMLQILGAGQGLKADRFTYMAYFGLFFILAWGLDWVIKKFPQYNIMAYGAAGIYILLFSYMTYNQCKIWKNGNTLWTHVLEHYDNISTPWGNRGQFKRDNGDIQGALSDYSQAIKMNPNKAPLYNSRGRTYFESNQTDLAIQDYSKGIELDPEMAELYVNRGAAYAKSGNYNQALIDLNKGEELDPEFNNTYLNRSLVYTVTEQYAKAIEDHTKYINLNPYNGDIWYERGMAKRRLGRDDDALADFNQAINLNPNQGIYYLGRGRLFFDKGNKDAGMRDAQTAQQLGRPEAASLIQQFQ